MHNIKRMGFFLQAGKHVRSPVQPREEPYRKISNRYTINLNVGIQSYIQPTRPIYISCINGHLMAILD